MLSNVQSLAPPSRSGSDTGAPPASTDIDRYLGSTIAGRYWLETLLAEGGMGLVFRARHLILDQPIALKLVRPAFAHDTVAVARFLDEARVIARVKSPHVARVFDSGTAEDGTPYMALELLNGWDLRCLLERDGPISCELAAEYVIQACHAISEIHDLGVVHRDLKPENLFLHHADDGAWTVKVLDFGISKYLNTELHSGGRSHTTVGETVGSPHYMSPEQMAAHSVDARTDIWALGVVLFELVTGQVPFPGNTVGEVCASLFAQEAPALSSFRSDVPRAFERVVNRCLRKAAVERYWHAEELAEALREFLSGSAPEERAEDTERPTLVSIAPAQRDSKPHSPLVPVLQRRQWRSGWPYLSIIGLLAAWGGASRELDLSISSATAADPVPTAARERAAAPFFAPIQMDAAAQTILARPQVLPTALSESTPAKSPPMRSTRAQAAGLGKAVPVSRVSWAAPRPAAPTQPGFDELIAPYPSPERAEQHDSKR
ncbi:MAG TPA: protein kinase [Polyangiaceae bacterium]|nr:protein kinase [Polyangiaceae bacterium]